jgi:prepilin-type N-terminal cleavage/methylation domain-containing protein
MYHAAAAVRTFCKALKSLLHDVGPTSCNYASPHAKEILTSLGMTLAEDANVRTESAKVRFSQRGFSLVELMVVILIIGIVAALAIPTMAVTGFDRHAYNDAGSIMMLFRSARTHAVARGGAVLIAMSANGTSDRGTFTMYEYVTSNVGGGANRTPVSSCKTPTNWSNLPTPQNPNTNPNIVLLDYVNLNSTTGIEAQADIETKLLLYPSPTSSAGVQFKTGYICYTPLGHTYVTSDASSGTAAPVFDGVLPTVSPIEALVTRTGGATKRSVLVPPNGMARVFSHT